MFSALRTSILFYSFSAICGTQGEHASITERVTDSSGVPIAGGFPSAYDWGEGGRNLLGGQGDVNFDFST